MKLHVECAKKPRLALMAEGGADWEGLSDLDQEAQRLLALCSVTAGEWRLSLEDRKSSVLVRLELWGRCQGGAHSEIILELALNVELNPAEFERDQIRHGVANVITGLRLVVHELLAVISLLDEACLSLLAPCQKGLSVRLSVSSENTRLLFVEITTTTSAETQVVQGFAFNWMPQSCSKVNTVWEHFHETTDVSGLPEGRYGTPELIHELIALTNAAVLC